MQLMMCKVTMMTKLVMGRYQINRMSGVENMNRVFIVMLVLLCVGCASKSALTIDCVPMSVVYESHNEKIHLTIDMDEENVLKCSCQNDRVEIVGMSVKLYTRDRRDIDDLENVELSAVCPDAIAAMVDDVSGELLVARKRLYAKWMFVSHCFDGAAGGRIVTEQYLKPEIHIPNDGCAFDCLGCDVKLKVGDDVSPISVYLFRHRDDKSSVRKFRIL